MMCGSSVGPSPPQFQLRLSSWPSRVDELLTVFLSAAGRNAERDRFRVRFDLMALQRNLKALGTFGYQTAVRQNPVYIQYIPRTLRYVRENLHKYERFGRLADLLAARIPELA
jgi:aminoglycoside/choline kinase family phosphotransferase